MTRKSRLLEYISTIPPQPLQAREDVYRSSPYEHDVTAQPQTQVITVGEVLPVEALGAMPLPGPGSLEEHLVAILRVLMGGSDDSCRVHAQRIMDMVRTQYPVPLAQPLASPEPRQVRTTLLPEETGVPPVVDEQWVEARIQAMRERIDAGDGAGAQEIENDLHYDVLRAIAAKRCIDHSECAKLALSTLTIPFYPRPPISS